MKEIITIAKKVNTINKAIAVNMDKFPCMIGYKLLGIAEPVVRRNYDGDEWFPVIVDEYSGDHTVFVDDDYPLGIYHRLLGKTYSTPKDMQFGDEKYQLVTTDMILVCWAFRKYLGSEGAVDTLERIIYSSMDNDITLVSSDFDRLRVFQNEFRNVQFFLPEDVLLFSMRYRFNYPIMSRECVDVENICKT